ncbi:MAG TPA: VWA domain-containing protein [Bryobacteraceae bacterium]|nr:VWA domain-containing protein [Bryobacteraceae bacterium]
MPVKPFRILLAATLFAIALPGQWRRVEQAPAQTEPSSQDQETVIRVEVEEVNVTCSVRDRNGRLIGDLTKEDFALREDGKPQEIKRFARDTDIPLTLGLLVDVSPSQERLIETEKDAASQFFSSVLRQKDLAFLMTFGSEAELVQDLTGSAKLLRAGLDELRVNASVAGLHPGPVPTSSQPRGTILYDAVYLAANERLRGQVGRKAMVLITDGIDQGSRVKIQEAIRSAHMADAMVYAIYYYDPGAYNRGGGWGYGGGSDGDLRKMAEETGGRVFKVDRKHTLGDVFRELQEELRSQYSLSYTPTDTARNGEFRKIEIKARDGDLKVQARKGYFATGGDPKDSK